MGGRREGVHPTGQLVVLWFLTLATMPPVLLNVAGSLFEVNIYGLPLVVAAVGTSCGWLPRTWPAAQAASANGLAAGARHVRAAAAAPSSGTGHFPSGHRTQTRERTMTGA